jgi:hypothetical protein
MRDCIDRDILIQEHSFVPSDVEYNEEPVWKSNEVHCCGTVAKREKAEKDVLDSLQKKVGERQILRARARHSYLLNDINDLSFLLKFCEINHSIFKSVRNVQQYSKIINAQL